MDEEHDPRRHNYCALVEAKAAASPVGVGEVRHIHVFHDDTCSIYKGGYCDCDPVISEPTTETDAMKVWAGMNVNGANP
ncbi:MAG: hypothetical protein WC683_13030 [bacterium]